MMIVTAGILEKDGRVLLAQRNPEDYLGLKWEFPGGKVEEGESPEACLERELAEELGIETRTGHIFDVRFARRPQGDMLILFYRTMLLSGEPALLDCHAVRWVLPEELTDFDLAPTDAEIASELKDILTGGDGNG